MSVGVILTVAIISLAVGYFAGLFLTRLRKDESNPVLPTETINNTEAGPRYEADRLQMVLWSKTPDGPLFADIDGKTISASTDLTPIERIKVDKALNDFQMWLGRPILKSIKVEQAAPVQTEQTIQTPDQVTDTQTAENVAASPEVLSESGVVAPATLTEPKPPISGETYPEVKPVPAAISLRTTPKPPPVQHKSIVEQINAILQEKVQNSPLAETGIILQETPKGVIVWVGKDSYQGVDSLPEGDAKKIIRAAVAEWEKK